MMPLIVQILLPVFVGLLIYTLKRNSLKYVVVFFQIILLISSILYIPLVQNGREIITLLSRHSLPMGMSLRLDTLSTIMLLLSNIMFLVTTLYGLKEDYFDALFLFLFFSLQGFINGIFLSNDMFNVYLLIEVSTIVVSILVMYKKDAQSMYDGMIYLMVNMVAMAFFLFGIGYIYKYFGLFDFGGIKYLVPLVKQPKTLIVPYAFLLTGIGLKSAIMPVFSWLPKAHGTASAPSIVSAILSGVFVKTGLYLFIRVTYIFGDVLDIRLFFLFAGYLTAILGFLFAMSHTNIKLILAYHTISQVGLILIGLNLDSTLGYQGAMYHILAHSLFKGLFFILAGKLIEIYKTRDITKMNGLLKKSPFLSVALIVAVLSITGAPFFSGGYSKAMLQYSEGIDLSYFLFLLINAGTMASFIKFFKVLPSCQGESVKSFTRLGFFQYCGISLLVILCIALGVFGNFFVVVLFNSYFSLSYLILAHKVVKYIVMYAFVYIIHSTLFHKINFFKKLRTFDMSFNNTVIAMVVFFISIIGYFYLYQM